jgi:hypothetical protein
MMWIRRKAASFHLLVPVGTAILTPVGCFSALNRRKKGQIHFRLCRDQIFILYSI